LGTIRRVSERLGQALEHLIAGFFFAILGLTVLLVTLRYVFNSGIAGGFELSVHLFIYTTAIGAAISVGRHQHIKIDYFVNRFLKARGRRIADIAVQVCIAGINGVMLYLSIPWIRQVGGFESPVLRLPEWMIKIAVPIGSGLAILFCILNIVRDLLGDVDAVEADSGSTAD
jgi:TRAP-type C4-dicarboxylate transport system permease small subunit